MIQDRNSIVLYTTAVCNLKCRYCYIDKNPALVTIDNILDESFSGDYYINYAKEVFPDRNQLKEIQMWGGEPTIRMDRAFHTIDAIIDYYPKVEKIMFSTNFTTKNWFEQLYSLLELLGKHRDRIFYLDIQLSIDGPENINDSSRGIGVTNIFKENFNRLIKESSKKIPNNVYFCYFFKPTLDSKSIRLLQNKESIIEYFKFFENFYTKHDDENPPENFRYECSIPNTACPSPHTKEDGILFANYCRLCREIEKENEVYHYFNHYRTITSFNRRSYTDYKKHGYSCRGGMCGSGKFTVGLLPNRMISVCHNGFVDLISDYKKDCLENNFKTTLDSKFFNNISQESRLTMPYEELSMYELQVESFYKDTPKARIMNIATLINLLARVKQVDEKYIDREKALEAAYFIQDSTSYCVRDNINSTGSMTLYPVGLLKLLLNGAREYIEEYDGK